MIAFFCPSCNQRLNLNDRHAGREGQCPNCKAVFRVPAGVEVSQSPTPSDEHEASPEQSIGEVETMSVVASVGDAETSDGEPAQPAKSTAQFQQVQGYQIVRELGRGGMGVVYEAFHPELKRTVALKMILAGGHASESQLQRFRIEAEAVARLKHPNIVQIYEIGEQGGLPFFSLEFCDGGALNDKLDGTPWQEKEAARIMETLARGVHTAHKAGVVHRDLKPHNVLLNSDGTPKITDFGLAKRLEEGEGMTKTESVMGTPSYMAPEQAKGRTKEVGPAADVYSLGAMLYELLTGRPPFKAASAWDTISQVINDEPISPRLLSSKVSKDLDTICLKCLEKEPSKRYESAEALADDLKRFQDGRPIEARPVGRGEKLTMWVKRNRMVASLIALVALVLITGTTVSIILAVKASIAQGKAEWEAERAGRSEVLALQREKEAIEARAVVERKNDELLTSMARSLGRPVGLGIRRAQFPLPPLQPPESKAFWELATTKLEDLRLRFVKEAFRSTITTLQFAHRAEEAWRATVGLSLKRRDAVEQLLQKKIKEKGIAEDQQMDLAVIAARLGNLSPALAADVASILTQAMARTTSSFRLRYLGEALSSLAGEMKSTTAAQFCSEAATSLTRVMTKALKGKVLMSWSECWSLVPLSEGLFSLAIWMEPNEATEACAQAISSLIQAFARVDSEDPDLSREINRLEPFLQILTSLVARMESKVAARTIAELARAQLLARAHPRAARLTIRHIPSVLGTVIARTEPDEATQALTNLLQLMTSVSEIAHPIFHGLCAELPSLISRIKRKDAAQVCSQAATRLIAILRDNRDNEISSSLARALSSLAARMDATEASLVCSQTVMTLTQSFTKSANNNSLRYLTAAVSSLSSHMTPKQAAQVVVMLLPPFEKITNPFLLRELSNNLSLLATRLNPREANQVCLQAANILIPALTKSTNSSQLQPLSQSLTSLAPLLESQEATRVGDTVFKVLNKISNAPQLSSSLSRALPSLSRLLSSLADRMADKDASRVCSQSVAVLTRTLPKVKHSSVLTDLLQGVSAWTLRLDSKDAGQIALLLIRPLSSTTYASTSRRISTVLSLLAKRMQPGQVAPVVDLLNRALVGTTNPTLLYSLSNSLILLADQREAKEASRVCSQTVDTLIQVLTKRINPSDRNRVSWVLFSVADRMQPEQIAQAVDILTQALGKTTNRSRLPYLSRSLTSLAPRLDSKQATRIAETITRAIKKTSNSSALFDLSQGLSILVTRMETRAATRVCAQAVRTMLQAMTQTTKVPQLISLSKSLTSLSPQLEPEQAAQTAEAFSQIIRKFSSTPAVFELSRGLSVLMTRMEPQAVGGACARAVSNLVQTMTQTTEHFQMQSLSRSLSFLAPRLDSNEATQAVSTLIELISRTDDSKAVQYLSQCLLALFIQVDSENQIRRGGLIASAVARLSEPSQLPSFCASIPPALKPLPCRFTTQQLVDFLKMPTCTGETKRIVVSQLENRFGRKLGNHWDIVRCTAENQLEVDFTSPLLKSPSFKEDQ